MERREGDIWYKRGTNQLGSGEIEQAIDSYRRALAGDRENRSFALSLATALAKGKHPDEARQALLRLRESDPEDAEINLALARLEASIGSISEAVHFYQNALYGRWKGTQVDNRRREIRVELVNFLLSHSEQTRALSELLILRSETPEDASAKARLAQLFVAAGDLRDALRYFNESVRLDPHSPEVLAEAGKAAFAAGDYLSARQYLEMSLAQGDERKSTSDLLSLARSVLALDPLQPRLSMKERRSRLLQGLDHTLDRVATCLSANEQSEKAASLHSLQSEAVGLQRTIHANRFDSDAVPSNFEEIYRLEASLDAACGKASGPDLALALIWRSHSGAQ